MANKTYLSIKHCGLRASVMAVASCLMLSGVPQAAHAAGLGRLVVFSALGQPLRAEIEVTATRQELVDMKAQLASPETFKQAGLDYATTLLTIRFNLEKRPNGQAVIRLTSDRPINDPFVDMLLELNWPAGRLVREYTFLLDPPEYAAKAPVSVAPAAVSAGMAPGSAPSAIDSDLRARASAQVRSQQQVAKPAPAAQPSVEGGAREVRRGETLHRIATETKPEGVSLDQMLVGLYRANPDAFEGGNMNRLRAGAILAIPEKSAVESVSPGEARKLVLAQSSDWNAYRSKLAGLAARAPAKEEAAKQEAAGKITAKVDDKAEQAQPKDQLKVSKTESAAGKGGAAAGKVSDEDLIAKDKALKDANERMAALERNVADLQKLVELKNQNLAELQKQASVKPDSAASAPKPVEPSKPVEQAPAPVAPTASPSAPAPEAAPAKVEPPPPPPAAVTTTEAPAQPVAPTPAEKPKVAAPPPPPAEPGFFEGLLENPMALAGGGGILALLAAYVFARRRRASAGESDQDLASTLTPPSTTSLTANSVFRSTGGQSVDTSSQTPAQTDFSQAGPGSIDTDEVDPVAEADVYMAYGRDAQAEEILLEARQKDPKRLAIIVKLLEIYSGRKDIKQFETLAADLYGETGGVGTEWEKASAMGRLLDPDNPIFRRAATVFAEGEATAAPIEQASDELALQAAIAEREEPQQLAPVATVEESAELASLDFDLGEVESKPEPAPEPVRLSESDGVKASAGLDFELGGGSEQGVAPITPAAESTPGFEFAETTRPEQVVLGTLEETAVRVEVPDLDFDIGTKIAPVVEQLDQQDAKAQLADLDFDLGAINLTSIEEKQVAGELPELGGDGVEFDVNLTESTFLGRSAPEPSSFDLSSIDLDLQSPDLELPAPEVQPKADLAAEAMPEQASEEPSLETAHMSTAVNPEFATEHMETLVVSSGFGVTQSDTAVNPDFELEQMETLVVPGVAGTRPDTAVSPDLETSQEETIITPSVGAAPDLAAELDISANEEVATKLDLAKAYEEMGDLEGARELLQEVLKEGDASQREIAQNLLAKISG